MNWLEELVIEWLDLDGFVISTSTIVSAGAGGRLAPDVVGAKLDTNERILIRHCEAAMVLIDNSEKVAERYSRKFGPKVEQAVRDRFSKIFDTRLYDQAAYEKWVIAIHASSAVRGTLEEKIPGIKIYMLPDFIQNQVLPTIKRWRELTNMKMTQLPADKWLLHMIDKFEEFGLMSAHP